MYTTEISNKIFDEERALYNLKNTLVKDCKFAGEADGESVLKECRDISVNNCSFSLRYPLWHAVDFQLKNSSMDELTRAPIWYSRNGVLENCKITGVKCLRECDNIEVRNCSATSAKFGWKCRDIKISDSNIDSVKNPQSGIIKADSVGEIIFEDAVMECNGKIICNNLAQAV